jgi:hypothetical protein
MFPTTHEVKSWPEFFNALKEGRKTFDIRRDDRRPAYAAGHHLMLREWDPDKGQYTGEQIRKRITDVQYSGGSAARRGIRDGYVGLSLADVS